MLVPLLERYARSIREGFPWKSHVELLPLVENGLSYTRKQTYVCDTCGFIAKGVPRHEMIINEHLQEAIDCQTPVPPPEDVRPFILSAAEITLLSDGLGWSQGVYELATTRRLMGCADLRRRTWEVAFFNPEANDGMIGDFVTAGLWYNARDETVECAYCIYSARMTGRNHLTTHAETPNCPLLRHEEYMAMEMLAPLAAPQQLVPAPLPQPEAGSDDSLISCTSGDGVNACAAAAGATSAAVDAEGAATRLPRAGGRTAAALVGQQLTATNQPLGQPPLLPQVLNGHTTALAQAAADIEVISLDSTVDDDVEQPVFSVAANARPNHPAHAGLLSRVVRRLEREGFCNRRIVNSLHRLPADRMGNIDAFYIVDGAVVPEAEPFKEEYACQICFNHKIAVMPNGCGDFKFCDKCLPTEGDCPICRAPYTKKVVIRTEFLD